MSRIQKLHASALAAAKNFKRSEIELLEALEQVDRYKVYYHLGCNSLFKYAVDILGLSEEVAYIFIRVCRKSREVPELKEEIKSGHITVSKAKKISSVLTPENKERWLSAARNSSKYELERKIATESPRATVPDRMSFVSPDVDFGEKAKPMRHAKVQLQAIISEQLMLKIRRAQDVLSQQRRQPTDLEATLSAAIDLFLEKCDPLERAKRQVIRGEVGEKLSGAPNETMVCGSELPDRTQLVPGPVPEARASSNQLEGDERKSEDGKRKSEDGNGESGDGNRELGDGNRELGDGNRPSIAARTPAPARNSTVAPARIPIPAAVRHKLYVKYEGRCAYVDERNRRCNQRRFLEIHHIRPVSAGGGNELSNLILLCAGHHKVKHLAAHKKLLSPGHGHPE